MNGLSAMDRHYTRYLGTPVKTHSVPLERSRHGHYHILEYRDIPVKGSVTLVTHGLSTIRLQGFAEEAMFMCYERFFSLDAIALLAGVIQLVIDADEPFAQGQVFGPAGSLFDSTVMEALFVYPPVYFPEEFKIVAAGEEIVDFVWLIPIDRREAEWIKQNGWVAFEQLLADQDPDLLDLARSPLSLPEARD